MIRPAIALATLILVLAAVTGLLMSKPDGSRDAARQSAAPVVAAAQDSTPPPTDGLDAAPEISAAVVAAPQNTPPEFQRAGVCARCHVVSVLEWGISAHLETEADCKSCHGPSLGHVENERNEVKPDHLPREAAIAKSCMSCHEEGCPESLKVVSCSDCHHMHALINPSKPPEAKDDRLVKLLTRLDQFRLKMEEGQKLADQKDWQAARDAYAKALRLIPHDARARRQLEMCDWRLKPDMPGFETAGEALDALTGLPRAVRVAELGIEMLLVPPGWFDMGSEQLAQSRPVHTVHVDAIYLGKHEITRDQWRAVMGALPEAEPSKDAAGGLLPVGHVSWEDCQEFVRRLNDRVAGGGFRLPTEAEWEYACRAALNTPPDVDQLPPLAWFRVNTLRDKTPTAAFLDRDAYSPRPVGTRGANVWGFHDMHGNVWEWCSSLARPYLYESTDGRERLSAAGMRVLRGGGFADSAILLDPAMRYAERPKRRIRWNGLRLARGLPSAIATTPPKDADGATPD